MPGNRLDLRSRDFSQAAMESLSPFQGHRVTWLLPTTHTKSHRSRSTLPLWCLATTTTHPTCKGHPRPSSLDSLALTASTEWTHSKTVKMRTLRSSMSSSTNATTSMRVPASACSDSSLVQQLNGWLGESSVFCYQAKAAVDCRCKNLTKICN